MWPMEQRDHYFDTFRSWWLRSTTRYRRDLMVRLLRTGEGALPGRCLHFEAQHEADGLAMLLRNHSCACERSLGAEGITAAKHQSNHGLWLAILLPEP